MPGLDPAIQPTFWPASRYRRPLDGRVKPGNDDGIVKMTMELLR
jgi:hypothetical protein